MCDIQYVSFSSLLHLKEVSDLFVFRALYTHIQVKPIKFSLRKYEMKCTFQVTQSKIATATVATGV